MNVKRYIVKDMQEAMQKIKYELGPEAIIISNRPYRKKGIVGWFSKPLIEVMAARESKNNLSPVVENSILDTMGDLPTLEAYNGGSLSKLEEQINALNQSVSRLTNRIEVSDYVNTFSDSIRSFYSKLKEHEIIDEVACSLGEKAQERLLEGDEDVNEVIFTVLSEFIGKSSQIKLRKSRRTIIMLVGPTGAGKTTTIAKIAAGFALNQNLDVGLITADVYRIAAYEQLKTYSDLMGIPLSIINSPDDVVNALSEYDDKDVVIIDTPGKSPYSKEHQIEILKLVKLGQIDEIHLVISATTGLKSMKDTIDSYSFLKEYKLVITKMDETKAFGTLINAIYYSKKPLSYICDGQSVPDNIEIANVRKIIEMLIKDVEDE